MPTGFQAPLDRLKRITGFVTVLYAEPDYRPLAFCRLYHVRRVAWVARLIANLRISQGHHINLERVDWLSWCHDLNRWPFAHNSETGVYDQAADVPRYFRDHQIRADADELRDIQAIIDKQHEPLTPEGSAVLLADIVTGFIEDPLWAVTGLDLIPELVPDEIADYLCIPIRRDELTLRLLDLNRTFFETKTVEPFMTRFDELFQETTVEFANQRNLADPTILAQPAFHQRRQQIKEGFMRGIIFPYNNVKISRGPVIKNRLVVPVLERLGDEAVARMTELDEKQIVALAQELRVLAPEEEDEFVPRLDYVAVHEPENSFRSRSSQ